MPPPTLVKPDAPPPTAEERITRLEKRVRQTRLDHKELRAMLGVTCGKVDALCDTLKPVVEWATVQIAEERKDHASWRETWRAAKKDAVIFLLKALFVIIGSALGIGWLAGGGA